MFLSLRRLTVEDEEVPAENLKIVLGRLTPEGPIVANAIGAMALLKYFASDPVILDIALPLGNGLRVYSNIVTASLKAPCCFLGSLTECRRGWRRRRLQYSQFQVSTPLFLYPSVS